MWFVLWPSFSSTTYPIWVVIVKFSYFPWKRGRKTWSPFLRVTLPLNRLPASKPRALPNTIIESYFSTLQQHKNSMVTTTRTTFGPRASLIVYGDALCNKIFTCKIFWREMKRALLDFKKQTFLSTWSSSHVSIYIVPSYVMRIFMYKKVLF